VEKEAIYTALDADWWTASTPNNWQTVFYSAVITFNAGGTTGCSYLSSAPFQTYGLNSGTDAAEGQLDNFINNLRLEAAQRLYDMHASAITGHEELDNAYNATA
jgi:hypothetical protein